MIFTISVSAVTKTGFYSENQTRDFVLQSVKLYEQDLKKKYYNLQTVETIDQFNYTQIWDYKEGSSIVSATMSYQFYDDRVEVTMTNPTYTTVLGTKSPLSSDDKMEFRRPLYDKLESMMFYVYFKYLMVSEKNTATGFSNSITENNYSSITQNYYNSTTKEQAKQKFVDFLSNFTYSNMTANYFYDKNADSQEVHFFIPSFRCSVFYNVYRGISIRSKRFYNQNKINRKI